MRGVTSAVRVALLLALGCLATCHGSMEVETAPYELGESTDIDGAEPIQDDDASASDYHIDSEDQEDRIGVSSVDDFDQDDTPQPRKRSDASDLNNELKIIQDDGDQNTLLGEADSTGAKSPEEIAAAASSVEQKTKANEAMGKQSDKAVEQKKKQNELTSKEADARADAERKAEVGDKESTNKAQKRSEEKFAKKRASEKARKTKNNELKAKDDKETDIMEKELTQTRKESEQDGKRETANEKSEKMQETATKADGVAEAKAKTAKQDKINAENAAVKEKEEKGLESRAKKDKKEADDAADKRKAADLRSLEEDKKAIKEQGDKAYERELTLESQHKIDQEDKRRTAEKAAKKKEMRSKQAIGGEQDEKASENRSKADRRDEMLDNEEKKASKAEQVARNGAQYEKKAKHDTMTLQKELGLHLIQQTSAEGGAERADKSIRRAYTRHEKKRADRNEKLSKSKLSEIQSKIDETKKKIDKSRATREVAGKVGRERANKFADAQRRHLKALGVAKAAAAKELDHARKARAEVEYLHSKSEEKDAKQNAVDTKAKEVQLKSEVVRADTALLKRHEEVDKTNSIERADEAGQKKRVEKASKFTQSHVEAREKELEIAKQKVQSWIKYDASLSRKVTKLERWKEKTAEAASEAIKTEAAAAKAVEGHAQAAERAQKKGEEVKEKEKMNAAFKELQHKDDQKDKQAMLKKMAEEKELTEKEQDRTDRADEKEEKSKEVNLKAQKKEEESGTKVQESKAKKDAKSLQEEKDTKKEKTAKTRLESNQKKDLDLTRRVTAAKLVRDAKQAVILRQERGGTTGAMMKLMAQHAYVQAKAAYSQELAAEKSHKLGVDAEIQAEKEKEQKVEKQKKEDAATAKKYELVVKGELGEKANVKLKAEKAGKYVTQEIGYKTKLKETQAAAAAEARKAVRDSEKSSKAIQEGRDKDEREQKQLQMEIDKYRERIGKRGAAAIALTKAKEARKAKKMDATNAVMTLGESSKKQEAWKEKLEALQTKERDDREKEMKALPYKIVVAEQIKYRKQSAEQQKVTDNSEKAFETYKSRWNSEEAAVKKHKGKERMLKEEKRSLLVTLAAAVQAEYKIGKQLKKDRAKMDADEIASQATAGKLAALERLELGQQQIEKAAAQQAAQLKAEAEKEASAASDKQEALTSAQSAAQSAAEKDRMEADSGNSASDREKASEAASTDAAQASSLQSEMTAAASAADKEQKKFTAEEAKQNGVKEKADAKRRQAQNKIVELKSTLAREKVDKKTQEGRMKKDEKSSTGKVRSLRHKEMLTKHAEIEERSLMQTAVAAEAELDKSKSDSDIDYTTNKELLSKAEEKVKMSAEAISSANDAKGGRVAKEAGTKTSIANNRQQYAKEEAADAKLRARLRRAAQARKDAADNKATTEAHFKAASEDERDGKHDALERNKKTEAAAIQRAIEKKNKAAEQAVKAYEKQREVRQKQFVATKTRGQTLKDTLHRLQQSKHLLSSKYGMTAMWQVDKMEKVAGEDVSFAEAKEKSAARVVEETGSAAQAASDISGHARTLYERAQAKLKKAEEVRDAHQASKEAVAKQKSMAHKEHDVKIAIKEERKADMDTRIAIMKEEKAKFFVKGKEKMFRRTHKKQVDARRHADDASQAKIDASIAYQGTKQHQESTAKLADRYRTLVAQISETTQKEKASAAAVKSQEKDFKYASDQVVKAKTSCTTGAKAEASIGRAYNKLKADMKEWSLKHQWLKQDPNKKAHGLDGTSDGADSKEMGEDRGATGHISVATATNNELVNEEMRDDLAPLSVVELIQEDASPEVTEWIFT